MASHDTERILNRNLRLYSWFLPLSSIYFWTPVYFLFFAERFPVGRVLQLDAIYYLAVVILEVPSGYFSDRIGRRVTLVIGAGAMAAGYALFLLGGASFMLFAAAQVAKAVGYAFLSGTTTSFHYDTLAALGRTDEFGDREARLARNGFRGAAVGAVAGGAVGSLDLSFAFVLALLNAILLATLALAMREPSRESDGFASLGFVTQLKECVRFLRTPFLMWVFFYFVFKTTTEHIPYEFSQPYLAQVLGEGIDDLRFTPIASGLLMAAIAAIASLVAGRSMQLRARLGVAGALLGVGAAQIALIAIMALVISPWVLPVLAFRSCQSALANPIIHSVVTPLVSQAQRATYLSIHSLAGRLGFSAVLFGLGGLAGTSAMDDGASLARLLTAGAVLSAAGLVALTLTHRAAREPQ